MPAQLAPDEKQLFPLPPVAPAGGGGSGGFPMFNFTTPTGSPTGPASTLTAPVVGTQGSTPSGGATPPGVVPPAGGTFPGAPLVGPSGTIPGPGTSAGQIGGLWNQGDFAQIQPLFPYFTNDFYNYLRQQMGQGATPFNLQAALPTGGTTGAGQLSAPMTPLLQQLSDYYSGKPGASGGPGMGTLSEMSKTGMPVDQTPAWQAMVDSMQRQIKQGAAGLREQFAFRGNLASSPFAGAETDYYNQANKDLNAQLLQGQAGALEAARGRQMSASQFLGSQHEQLGELMQNMDQQSIDRLLQEFIRTRPEYSPFLNMLFGAATTFPSVIGKQSGVGAAGAALSGAGTAASGIADLIRILKG
jgi:hypothetical protein